MAARIKYEIILYWSKNDEAFIAEVPELPGCAADGPTYQDAVANVEVVKRPRVETLAITYAPPAYTGSRPRRALRPPGRCVGQPMLSTHFPPTMPRTPPRAM